MSKTHQKEHKTKEQKEHKEWRKENSLTAVSDRNMSTNTPKTYSLKHKFPELKEDQVTMAMEDLNNTSFVERFPEVERRYVDPVIPLQRIGLISFVPAKGATPNSNGFYGFAKLRGNYDSVAEANDRAEFLIRHVDSYHQIYHSYVGRPFPITDSTDCSLNIDQVDMKKEIKESVSHNVKNKRTKEEREMQEIKDREEELLSDVKREPEDPTLLKDTYITLQVKKAQLTWTFLETEKKLNEMKNIIIKTRQEIKEMDEKDPSYKEMYFKKYMDARSAAGLSVDQHGDNFIKYMVGDAFIPGIDN